MRRVIAASSAAVVTFGLVGAVPAVAAGTSDVDSTKLTTAVQVNGILQHLRQLQTIADRNGGNRASGLPGYDASATYVASTLRRAGYRVTRQEFTFPYFREKSPSTLTQTTPTRREIEVETFQYSGSGDVSGSIVPTKDLVVPAGPTSTSTSGCEASDFVPAPSQPAVALIQRGTCPFGTKVANAQAAGYEAAVLFNSGIPGETGLIGGGTLGEPSDIPVVAISYTDGVALARSAGSAVRVTTDTEADLKRKTSNVVAQWPGTTKNDDQVVVVGAHLDSVTEGPGINDNGTGSAAVLEIAEQYAAKGYVKRAQRPVRFAFWGAEELGLLGSQHYVDTLTDAQRSRIYANLNFDMLGSPNFARLVYDGDGSATETAGPAGSAEIEKIFTGYFSGQRLATEPTAFDGRSDYGPFIQYGIPAGGLFSGAEEIKTAAQATRFGGTAGVALDANYHGAGDDITNVNPTVLGQLSDGAAHATAVLTQSKAGLYGDGARARTLSQRVADPKYRGSQAVR